MLCAYGDFVTTSVRKLPFLLKDGIIKGSKVKQTWRILCNEAIKENLGDD
ncbi:hypothetical protein [Clostridium butyricum]|nr:hypothetical protein [Clostridium butyricum]